MEITLLTLCPCAMLLVLSLFIGISSISDRVIASKEEINKENIHTIKIITTWKKT